MNRSLHLVDIENLVGLEFDSRSLQYAAACYADIAGVGPLDLVVVASAPRIGVAVKAAFPSASVRWRSGEHGADLALLEGAEELPLDRFERLVVGSGDGVFAGIAQRAKLAGLRVTVVSRRAATARSLCESWLEHRPFVMRKAA